VGVITFDRPEKKNPLTFDSYVELRDLFRPLSAARDIRAVVLAGAGGTSARAGRARDHRAAYEDGSGRAARVHTMTADPVKAMRACRSDRRAVEARARARARSLALFFRLRYARSRRSRLFKRVGLAGCDMAACAMLPPLIGQGRAAELLIRDASMSGEEGLAWGFFNALAEPERCSRPALDAAKQLAPGRPSRTP